jgi:hypothetical protein
VVKFNRPRVDRRNIPSSPPENIEKTRLEIRERRELVILFGQTKTELIKESKMVSKGHDDDT